MNYHDIALKAFEDTMDLLVKREQEEYNQLNEQDFNQWVQALEDDQEVDGS